MLACGQNLYRVGERGFDQYSNKCGTLQVMWQGRRRKPQQFSEIPAVSGTDEKQNISGRKQRASSGKRKEAKKIRDAVKIKTWLWSNRSSCDKQQIPEKFLMA
jgi:hypothetical protein